MGCHISGLEDKVEELNHSKIIKTMTTTNERNMQELWNYYTMNKHINIKSRRRRETQIRGTNKPSLLTIVSAKPEEKKSPNVRSAYQSGRGIENTK